MLFASVCLQTQIPLQQQSRWLLASRLLHIWGQPFLPTCRPRRLTPTSAAVAVLPAGSHFSALPLCTCRLSTPLLPQGSSVIACGQLFPHLQRTCPASSKPATGLAHHAPGTDHWGPEHGSTTVPACLQAKEIKTHVRRNAGTVQEHIAEYQALIDALQAENRQLKARLGAVVS